MTVFKKWFSKLGPGFITGASDDDPAGIATYAQTGAVFGLSQLWTALFTTPMMIAVQIMCGKIGLVTGKGLAGIIRQHYSKWILYPAVFLLFIANTINLGANLGAMAASVQLLFFIPFYYILLLIAGVSLFMQIFVPYKIYASYLKYLSFALLSYVVLAFVVDIDLQKAILATVIPTFSFSHDYLLNIVAILGTTISPYLFFWQTSEEVEEEVQQRKISEMGKGIPKVSYFDIRKLKIDTISGMFFSNIIMWFIIVTTGSTLFTNNSGEIQTAADAALVLRPVAGEYAFLLFALGIIGTGFLAIPILAGSVSYAVSEAFGWHEGLYKKLKGAPGFYGVIAVCTLIGILINFVGINPMKALYYSAVVNGIIAPPLLVMILLISNNEKIMGNQKNSKVVNYVGIITILVMSTAAVLLILSLI